MKEKGTILIIDDRIEEKIGIFEEYLKIDGYTIKIAQTLEEADRDLSTLLGSNKLDGIILDFSFPIDENDASVTKDDKPNGIYLFRKYEFKIKNQRIPIVINTTAEEEHKRKYLGDLNNLGTPVYNVNHEANPLAQSTNREMVRDILRMFNERTEQRRISSQIQADRRWNIGGKSIIRDPKTGNYMYRN